jgi:hypothetical protein
LVRQGGVAAGEAPGDDIAEPQRLAGDVKRIQAVVIEGPRRPAHRVDLSTGSADSCLARTRTSIISITCATGIDRLAEMWLMDIVTKEVRDASATKGRQPPARPDCAFEDVDYLAARQSPHRGC